MIPNKMTTEPELKHVRFQDIFFSCSSRIHKTGPCVNILPLITLPHNVTDLVSDLCVFLLPMPIVLGLHSTPRPQKGWLITSKEVCNKILIINSGSVLRFRCRFGARIHSSRTCGDNRNSTQRPCLNGTGRDGWVSSQKPQSHGTSLNF